jgi:hypothetical protein
MGIVGKLIVGSEETQISGPTNNLLPTHTHSSMFNW